MNGPKYKPLTVRLDWETYRKLTYALEDRGLTWTALAECLAKEWLVFVERENKQQPFDMAHANDRAHARMLTWRRKQGPELVTPEA